MTEYEDMDEELRRILDEGSASSRPAELAELRATIPPEPMGEELPKGTKVVFAEPDVAAPPPSRVPISPRAVDVSSEPTDDMELAAARLEDRQSRAREAFERGSRQLIGGLTRTAPVASTPGPVDAVAQLLAKRKDADAQRARGNQERLGAAKLDFDTKEAARKAAEDKARDSRDFDYHKGRDTELATRDSARDEESKRHNLETEKTGRMSALKPRGPTVVLGADGRPVPSTYRDQLKADALKPRAGWEPIDPAAPTFRDPAQAKAFDDSVAAMGAIRNHRDHVMHELDALKKAKSVGEADIIAGRLNAQMGALASKLRAAEGLNNTDAANHAIETMLSLQNGSAINWKNVVNEGRLPGILGAAIDSGEANLNTIAESNNLRRGKGGAPAGPVAMKFPDGSVHPVDSADMAEAKARGAVPNG